MCCSNIVDKSAIKSAQFSQAVLFHRDMYVQTGSSRPWSLSTHVYIACLRILISNVVVTNFGDGVASNVAVINRIQETINIFQSQIEQKVISPTVPPTLLSAPLQSNSWSIQCDSYLYNLNNCSVFSWVFWFISTRQLLNGLAYIWYSTQYLIGRCNRIYFLLETF